MRAFISTKHPVLVKEGHSVLVHVKGFLPYFFIAVPRGFVAEDIQSFMSDLNVRQGLFVFFY
jgi:DNA polymerase delta subunit 1